MKLFLFWGSETELWQFLPQLKLIEKVIQDINPKQVLHIPFARTIASEPEWEDGWFKKHINIKEAKYLNAKNEDDINKADNPLIFISGGWKNLNLINQIKGDTKLLKLVNNATIIIGESAWAKILCEYFSKKGNDENSDILPGLNIIKNTIIEPHYTERWRQNILIKNLEQSWVRYGIGIDSATAIELDTEEFPNKYKKIGDGKIDIKINASR